MTNKELYKKCKDLRDLRDNWDSEGSPCPEKETIDSVQTFLEIQPGVLRYVEDINVDVMGGVGVSFFTKRVRVNFINTVSGIHVAACFGHTMFESESQSASFISNDLSKINSKLLEFFNTNG